MKDSFWYGKSERGRVRERQRFDIDRKRFAFDREGGYK